MSVAFRSDASVTNGTAGTSVTVTKPAATADGDVLVAFVFETGVGSITAPAGWTLIGSKASSTSCTLAAYWKAASSEGASWTWTLGASVRNWGWVGAYTGVHTTNPVAYSTSDTGPSPTVGSSDYFYPDSSIWMLRSGLGITAVGAIRTASGVATTWTTIGTLRESMSSNAGAGTDVGGCIGNRITALNSGPIDGRTPYVDRGIASQSQTTGSIWAVTLRASFTAYTGRDPGVIVEAAWGEDPGDSDPTGYTFSDITDDVLQQSAVVITKGRANERGQTPPTQTSFAVLNINGPYTPELATGSNYPNVRRNVPIRVSVSGFGAETSYERSLTQVASWTPRWEPSLNVPVVAVAAAGKFRRLGQGEDQLGSPLFRAFASGHGGEALPVAYWPLEDEVGSTAAASALGHAAATVAGATFAGGDDIAGSAPALLATASGGVSAIIPPYPASTMWSAYLTVNIPATTAVDTELLRVSTTGTAKTWIAVIGGASTPDTIRLRAYDAAGTQVLDGAVVMVDADFYAHPAVIGIDVTQVGTLVSYTITAWSSAGLVQVSSTLASYTCGNATSAAVLFSAGYSGATVGHLGIYASSATNVLSDIAGALDGAVGETPAERMSYLTAAMGLYAQALTGLEASTGLPMGAQPIDDAVALFRECDDAELGVMHDGGPYGAVVFGDRSLKENAPVDLDLPFTALIRELKPVFDDRPIVNDYTASRSGGSTGHARDEASIALDGEYKDGGTVNLRYDSDLRQYAGWKVHQGVAPGMRYPGIEFNLRKNPELAEQWLSCRIGSRIQITGFQGGHPTDDLDLILEGYTERISTTEWSVVLNCSPFSPWKVGIVADTSGDTGEWLGRYAGDDNAALRVAVDDNDLSLEIDPNRYRWTTVADDFDPDLRVRLGGEVVEVSGISTTAGTYVAVGAASHADNAAVAPALYAGETARDMICVLARSRSAAGTLATPTGYTLMKQVGNLYFFAKVHSGSESAPTVTPSGGSAGDTVSAITFGLRGTPCTLDALADAIVDSAVLSNAANASITYPGIYPIYQEGCILLLLAGMHDDWLNVVVPSGWTEIGEPQTSTGNDQGMYLAYQIQTTPAVANGGLIQVNGGTAVTSECMVLALAAGYQTFTVSARSTNGVIKSHAANTRIEAEDAFVVAL